MADLLRVFKMGGGDTFTDRLSSRYSCVIIITMATVSAFKVYFTDSMFCKTPSQFTASDVDYVNKECFSARKYLLPEDIEYDSYTKHTHYHLWIPLFLVLQAFLFYLPRRFWKQMGSKCGLSVSGVVDACLQIEKSSLEDVVERVDRFLSEASEGCLANAYLVFVYLVTKVLYIANAILQLLMLNMFLKRTDYMYGLETVGRFIEGKGWRMSKTFPKTVICSVDVKYPANTQNYSLQCSLPINMFYEVAVTFLWLWLLYVVVCSIFSFFSWLLTSFITSYQVRWVRRRVGGGEGVDDFVRKRLGLDGCFILHMVSSNCNDVVASQLLSRLWQRYTQQLQEEQQPTLKEAIYPTLN